MILASRSGNLTAIEVVRETPKGFVYLDLSMNGSMRNKERRVGKYEAARRVFHSVDEALNWLEVSK